MGTVRGLTLLPVLSVPFAVHYAVVEGRPLPLLILLAGLLSLLLLRLPLRGWLRLSLFVLLAVVVAMAAREPVAGHLLPLFPPLFVFLGLAATFGVTLLPGRRPLVTRIAAALGDPLDAALLRYTRQVTAAWVALFLLLAGLTLVLWLLADHVYWSLFTNLISYLLVLSLFAAEYRLRCRRFAFARARGFVGFMRALARLQPRELLR